VHIAVYRALYGSKGIRIKDFVNLSPRVVILSASDDFSGEFRAGPIVPQKYTNVRGGEVIINKYVMVEAGSVVQPNLTLGEGAAIGAMSLVNKSVDGWAIYVGIPVEFIKNGSKNS
jgi:galactoside O-acetyltransferase